MAASLPATAIEALRLQHLAELVRFISARSPFFRRRLGPSSKAFCEGTPIAPDSVRTAEGAIMKRDLNALPIVTLADIAEESQQILTDPRVTLDDIKRGARTAATGDRPGSHQPAAFRFVAGGNATRELFLPFNNAEWNLQTAALLHRTPIAAALGTSGRSRVVSFASQIAASAPERLLKRLGLMRRWRTTVKHVSPERVESDCEAIRSFSPTTLWGAAGPIEVFAAYALRERWETAVRWVVVPAEDLTRGRRALIQSAFPLANVIAWLGASLGLPIATSCLAQGTLHVVADHFVVEPVDHSLHPVPVGVEGTDVLLTALRLRTLPIVRLVLPFHARLLPSCPCGSNLPALEFEGSDGDLLWISAETGDRVPVPCGYIVDRLLILAGVARARATLDPTGSLKVVFATGKGHRSDHVAPEVLSEIDSILRGRPSGARLRVTVEEVGPSDPSFTEHQRENVLERRARPRVYLQQVK